MKKIVLALAAVAALTTGNAFAQAYIGAAVGASRIDVDCEGTISCDKNDTAAKLFGGFKFSPNLAGELMYFNYGKVDAGVPVVGGVIDTEVEGEGVGVGIAFMGDFAPQISGVARLGVVSNKTKIRGSGLGVTVSDSDRKAQPYIGLGVSYALTPQWKLDGALDFTRLEFQNEKANVQMLMIGVTYGF